MASLMRALIIDGTRSAGVQRVAVPAPGPRQVVVDIHRVGICGTDIELFTRELPYFEQGKSRFPLCPGHEWCGTVSATGAEAGEDWIGVRVTGDTMLGCGRCRRCASGRHHVCADRSEIGRHLRLLSRRLRVVATTAGEDREGDERRGQDRFHRRPRHG